MNPKIPIVNEKDEVIDYKDRAAITSKDIYRVAGLWVTNSQGDILLARRAFTKMHDPGKWGPAAAGTVEADETYESNIIKEAQEELSLKNLDLITGPKYLSRGDKWTHFTQVFFTIIDTELDDIKIDETEVAEVRWFSKDELDVELSVRPQDFLGAVKNFLNHKMINTNRQRVSAVIVKNDKILLIKRVKPDKIYYVFPGGGVEVGESIEQALIREIREELSLEVSDYKFLFSLDLFGYGQSFGVKETYQNNFYLVTGFSGQSIISGPEKQRMNKDNIYEPVWLNKEEMFKLPNLKPTEAVSKLASLKLIP